MEKGKGSESGKEERLAKKAGIQDGRGGAEG